jgi:PKHD-type hydroxylase
MFENSKGFVGVVPNAYTDEECDDIISLRQKYKREDGAAYNTDPSDRREPLNDDTRLSDVFFMRYFDEPWIIDKTIKAANKFNEMFCKWDIDWFGLNHEMQLAEYYKPGHHFEWHRDIHFESYREHWEALKERKYKRKISAIIQLDDPKTYVGGRLQLGTDAGNKDSMRAEFDDVNQDWLQRGSMIFFPSFVNHKVDPIISGSRASFTIWYLGPPWR